MAYQGWLLKIGNYTVPTNKFVRADGYSAYVNMQDLDPYTDADGYLHRKAVQLKALKVEFETPNGLTNTTFEELMSNIRANYVDADSRGCYITAYIPEYDDYITQYGYMSDPKPTIYGNYSGKITYNAVKFSFIGGVYPE